MYYIQKADPGRAHAPRCYEMDILQTFLLQCPSCGEQIEIVVDCSLAEQEYVEDCEVCCNPMIIRASSTDEGEIDVEARPENG